MTVEIIEVVTEGPQGVPGPQGEPGPTGAGVPAGGSTNQALVKVSGADQDTQWDNQVTWQGTWDTSATYPRLGMSIDEGWLGIANKDTDEKLAPVAVGAPETVYPVGVPLNDASVTSVVYSGIKVTTTKNGWISSIRVKVPTVDLSHNHRIVIADITDPNNPSTRIISSPLLRADEWIEIFLPTKLVAAGSVLVVYIDVLNTSGTTSITGAWNYIGDGQNTNPTSNGQWSKRSGSTLRVNKFDLLNTDRSADLLSMQVGSEITFADAIDPIKFWTFRVLENPVDKGSYFEFETSVIDQGLDISVSTDCDMNAVLFTPGATQYLRNDNYWVANQPDYAVIEGYLAFDGVNQNAQDHAFGVTMDFQEATISADWDIMASTEAAAGGGSGQPENSVQAGTYIYGDSQYETVPLAVPGNTPTELPNDGLHPISVIYKLDGIEDLWDSTTDRFDFTKLGAGDQVSIRLDLTAATTSPNQKVQINFEGGEGSPGPFSLSFIDTAYKDTGEHLINRYTPVFMLDTNATQFPSKFVIESDGPLNVTRIRYFCNLLKFVV